MAKTWADAEGVRQHLGYGSTKTVWLHTAAGILPQPRRITQKCSRWDLDEVDRHIESHAATAGKDMTAANDAALASPKHPKNKQRKHALRTQRVPNVNRE